MGKKYLFAGLFLFLLFFILSPVLAADQDNELEGIAPELTQPDKFYRAEVLSVQDEQEEKIAEQLNYSQTVRVRLLQGAEKGKEISILDQGFTGPGEPHKLKPGDTVIIGQIPAQGGIEYYIADKYRLPAILWMLGIFFALGILFAGRKGFTSLLGLAASIAILAMFVVPKILAGENPLAITLVGACAIAILSIFLAHGIKKRTALAAVATLITLFVATGLAWLAVHFGRLFGLGSEEAFYLQVFPGVSINLQGLLLAGIIIGTLGVLDDVTTTQTAAVDEISGADPKLSWTELYRRGLSVGHEHIAALINTLALAYAGSSLPLFLLFILNKNQPLWVILNGELVAEEIVRTLVGSAALILAVPISTFLAARFLGSRYSENTSSSVRR